MATTKKTNFVSYELEKLESYVSQLQGYLDNNPPDQAEDRLDVRYNERTGSPTVKVIATKESIVKLFSETLAKLPTVLESLNTLRKAVSEEIKAKDVRGDQAIPGFMLIDDTLSKEEDDTSEYVDNHYKKEVFDDDFLDPSVESLPVPAVIEHTPDDDKEIDFTNVPITTVSPDDWTEWEED